MVSGAKIIIITAYSDYFYTFRIGLNNIYSIKLKKSIHNVLMIYMIFMYKKENEELIENNVASCDTIYCTHLILRKLISIVSFSEN